DQDRPAMVGVELFLQIAQSFRVTVEHRFGGALGEAARVGRIERRETKAVRVVDPQAVEVFRGFHGAAPDIVAHSVATVDGSSNLGTSEGVCRISPGRTHSV